MALYFLTCKDREEADKISQTLLDKKLVVCVKKSPVSSQYLWKGSIENSDEVFLIMDSTEEKFEEIEKVVKNLHSYSLPNLVAIPISSSSKGVSEWLREGLE